MRSASALVVTGAIAFTVGVVSGAVGFWRVSDYLATSEPVQVSGILQVQTRPADPGATEIHRMVILSRQQLLGGSI